MSEEINASKLEKFGLVFSKIYLIVLLGGVPVAALFGVLELKSLELNELGDFFAGAFGPLAIFWLVLGFFQQSRELQNSVAALQLQAKELNNSVKQQAEMVMVTRETLNHEKEVLGLQETKRKQALQPKLKATLLQTIRFGDGTARFGVNILNQGQTAYDLNATLRNSREDLSSFGCEFLENTKTLSSDNLFGDPITFPDTCYFLEISYLDSEQDAKNLSVMFEPNKTSESFSARIIA